MLRWIVILVVAWLVFELVLRLLTAAARRVTGAHPRAVGGRGTKPPSHVLVRCPRCGVHFPAPPGAAPGALVHCSEECRRAAALGPA